MFMYKVKFKRHNKNQVFSYDNPFQRLRVHGTKYSPKLAGILTDQGQQNPTKQKLQKWQRTLILICYQKKIRLQYALSD